MGRLFYVSNDKLGVGELKKFQRYRHSLSFHIATYTI